MKTLILIASVILVIACGKSDPVTSTQTCKGTAGSDGAQLSYTIQNLKSGDVNVSCSRTLDGNTQNGSENLAGDEASKTQYGCNLGLPDGHSMDFTFDGTNAVAVDSAINQLSCQ